MATCVYPDCTKEAHDNNVFCPDHLAYVPGGIRMKIHAANAAVRGDFVQRAIRLIGQRTEP